MEIGLPSVLLDSSRGGDDRREVRGRPSGAVTGRGSPAGPLRVEARGRAFESPTRLEVLDDRLAVGPIGHVTTVGSADAVGPDAGSDTRDCRRNNK